MPMLARPARAKTNRVRFRESGEVIPDLEISHATRGTLSPHGDVAARRGAA
jgi:hypothetical protein